MHAVKFLYASDVVHKGKKVSPGTENFAQQKAAD
jgi:hypothetical protein